MEAIIGDTLTLARQGDNISETESVSMTDLVGKCWTSVDTNDATIEIVNGITFQGNPDRLQHVSENLSRNAVEHGGSDVTVRVGRHGGRESTSKTMGQESQQTSGRKFSNRAIRPPVLALVSG